MIAQAKKSKSKESNFHQLAAGKKTAYGSVICDKNIFDIQYVVPEQFHYSKDNDGQCMLYALLLLLHTDNSELALKLLKKTQDKKGVV